MMSIMMYALIKDVVHTHYALLWLLAHMFVIYYRFHITYKYHQIKNTKFTLENLNHWTNLYMIGTSLTGLLWGSLFYILQEVPTHYYFIIYGINVGLVSAGLLSLGMIASIYLSFLLPIIGLSILWMLLQGESTHTLTALLTLLGLSYYFIFSKKYSHTFMQMLIDKLKIQHQIETIKQAQLLNKELLDRTELALKGSGVSVLDWDFTKHSAYISPNWKEMLGYKDSELSNKYSTWKHLVHKEDLLYVLKNLRQAYKNKETVFETTHRLQHKEGYYIWIYGKALIFYNDKDVMIRMIGTHTDISERKALQLQNLQKEQIIEQISDAIITFDLKGKILTWSNGATQLYGYKKEEVIGKSIQILNPQEKQEEFNTTIQNLLENENYHVETTRITKEKKILSVSISLGLIKDNNEQNIMIVSYTKDISQRKKSLKKIVEQQDELVYLAHHDTLTGLPNRLLFNDRLIQAMNNSKRSHTKMALFFIDLDHFKEINDSLGHEVGDLVLQEVTQRIISTSREDDKLARLGGDEFTIILEGLERGEDASFLAQKIVTVLAEPILVSGTKLFVTSSIGISLYPDDGDSVSELLKYADSAMYKAKDEGRNNYQFYKREMTELALERVIMEASLRDAIKYEEFVVYYQPQVNARKNKLVGMEALVRWRHPTLGLIPPNKFIPLAETTGLIVELDRFVMKTAMHQLASWYEQGYNPGVLAMNLAIKQLRQKDFIEMFTTLIETTQCKTEYLELEITENQIMTNPQEAIKTLHKISALGIELAIDDFGTGYSSLSYLKKLPIDKLKIDQSFVKNLPDDKEDASIAKAVIALAKSLKLRIIAEGVETKAQKTFMIKNGCDNIQGYFYSKPIPADEFEELLKNGLKKV